MAVELKIVPLPIKPEKKKPRNTTSDGRRCVRVDDGTDPATGKRIRKAFYGSTLKEAQKKADDYKRAKESGINLADQDKTVTEWADIWFKTYGSKGAPGTIRQRNVCVKRLQDALGSLRLVDVRNVHLQQYADSFANVTKLTARNYRNVAQSIFRAAVLNRIITFDPTAGVKWPGQQDGTHRALNRKDIDAIATHWREDGLGAIIMLMLYTGMRRGEALGLRWSDVDLDAGIIHVRQAMQVQEDGNTFAPAAPKTPSSIRDIPILPALRAVLDELPHTSDYVSARRYPTAQIFLHAVNGFSQTMQQYLGDDFVLRSHDLRHTFASICYDAGVDIKTAQALLGHSKPTMTMDVYTHISDSRKDLSVDALKTLTNSFGHQMGINNPENS